MIPPISRDSIPAASMPRRRSSGTASPAHHVHGETYLPNGDFIAADIRNVLVFDFDDTLKNEQAFNYRIAHNALAQAAHEYGDRYPLLPDVHRAVQHIRTGDRAYRNDLPVMCMSETQFANHGYPAGTAHSGPAQTEQSEIRRRKVLSPFYHSCVSERTAGTTHLFTDLLDHLHGLDETLARRLQTAEHTSAGFKQRLESLLFSAFFREYNARLLGESQPTNASRVRSQTQPAAPALRPPNAPTADYVLCAQRLAAGRGALQAVDAAAGPKRVVRIAAARRLAEAEKPFPAPTFPMMPGARELLGNLDAVRTLVLIVSNRKHPVLRREVEIFRRQNDVRIPIHAVSGLPEISENGNFIGTRFIKPDNTRLARILDDLSAACTKQGTLKHAGLLLVGDSESDITQAVGLHHDGPIHGFYIHPKFAEKYRSRIPRRPAGANAATDHIDVVHAPTLHDVQKDIAGLLSAAPQ